MLFLSRSSPFPAPTQYWNEGRTHHAHLSRTFCLIRGLQRFENRKLRSQLSPLLVLMIKRPRNIYELRTCSSLDLRSTPNALATISTKTSYAFGNRHLISKPCGAIAATCPKIPFASTSPYAVLVVWVGFYGSRVVFWSKETYVYSCRDEMD